ncbi:MAG TPA: CHAP domain-containing protein [Actinomycetes bacterium]
MSAESVIDTLLKLHHKELERKVTRVPLGSNSVKYNTWYYDRKVSGDEYMWCAVYQSWINAMAGVPMDIYPKAAGVVTVRDFFKDRGRIFQKPQVGDYVIFIFSADEHHIGFVEKLEGGGKFSSLEGNVMDRVVRTHHREGDRGIVGYARPEYEKVEDDMTKDELVDVLRAALSPGFATVNEWASQLNEVKRDVEQLKEMVERLQH